MALYDSIGVGYATYRRADPRLVARLAAELPPEARAIAEIGAGTGNYARAFAERGLAVEAIEPSAVMRAQAQAHPRVRWHDATAELLPLAAGGVDAVVAVLSFHHYRDPAAALREMDRVAGAGPIALLTYDPRGIPPLWLADYWPGIWRAAHAGFPAVADLARGIAEATGRGVAWADCPIPRDCVDLFAGAAWADPGRYLDAEVRRGMSAFARADPAEVAAGLDRLRDDLATGRWRETYARLADLDELHVGYRIVVARR